MFVVYFFENRNLLLSQFLNSVPSVGDNLTIKGRKGTVSSVTSIEDNKVYVQVIIEQKASKAAVLADNSKKKKR